MAVRVSVTASVNAVEDQRLRITAHSAETVKEALMFLVLDTETSGLDPITDQIIDIHSIAMDRDGNTLEYYGTKVKLDPGVIMSPEAAKVNGYPDGWETAIDIHDAIEGFNKKFAGGSYQLLGWNPGFDYGFLQAGDWIKHFKLSHHPFDVYSLAYPLLKDLPLKPGRHNVGLGDAFKYLVPGVELPKMHSAIGDVLACIAIYKRVMGVK